jgi:glycosyltransferase involved in cell wall biosynthesis
LQARHYPFGPRGTIGARETAKTVVVSVIIPVFNGAATVARAIDSVLVQEFKPGFEIIAVNDGSTDCTAQILAGYENDIRIVKHNNRGPAAARNTGAANAEGEFLAFLDADDFWEPVMLENTVRALRCNPAAVLAYCNAATFDPGGWLVASSLVASDRNHPPSMAELLTRWWPVLPSAVTIRKRVFEECGGFAEDLRAYEDVHFCLLARERGPFEYLSRPLLYYCETPLAQRMARYERYHRPFVTHVRRRYGRSARGIVRDTHRAYVTAFGYQGLMAMRAGDMGAARRSFIRALRHAPLDSRTVLRLARTFLPQTLAQRLSGSAELS